MAQSIHALSLDTVAGMGRPVGKGLCRGEPHQRHTVLSHLDGSYGTSITDGGPAGWGKRVAFAFWGKKGEGIVGGEPSKITTLKGQLPPPISDKINQLREKTGHP